MFIQASAPSPSAAPMSRSGRPHVVVAGGGREVGAVLRGLRGAAVDITLVGAAEPALAENVTALPGRVAGLDTRGRRLTVRAGGRAHTLDYDKLVLAPGSWVRFAGEERWQGFDAADLAERVRLACEYAESEPDPAERARLLTFVVTGSGRAATEIARAVANAARGVVSAELQASGEEPRTVLVTDDRGDGTVEAGVEVVQGTVSTAGDRVTFGTQTLATGTVIMAEGVLPSEAETWLGAGGGFGEVYVIEPNSGQGAWVAETIRLELEGRAPRPYRAVHPHVFALVLRRLRLLLSGPVAG